MSVHNNNSFIEGITPVKYAVVLQLSNMHMIFTGPQVFPMIDSYYPLYGSLFNLSSIDLWIFLKDSYVQFVPKNSLSSCSFQQEMTLAEHMQIILAMEIPKGSDWMHIMPHWFQQPQALVGNVT